jgi:acyl-CoA dehydrogenase
MISRSEKKQFLDKEPRFDDFTCGLRAMGAQPKGIIKEAREVMVIGRKFAAEVVRPYALELDLKMTEDHDYLPWEFIKKANEWGFYTMFIPKIFGGKGYNFSCFGYFIEEIASACLAMGNLIGVHYLGVSMLTSSWNLKMMNKILSEVAEGEKNGKPCLLTLAMTEPDAGTDSQNTEFMNTGNLRCHAKKVDGGYVVNGTKIFISCGHLSTWHMVHAYTDLDRAAENIVMLAVKTGAKGFSFGKTEKKMGQKGSIASELIFNNCFIPDKNICIDNRQMAGFKRSNTETNAQIFAYIWGASRVGVGYFGTAAARGAYEEALRFASEKKVDGRLLINHEWCQCMLAEMYTNVAVSRASCLEGMQANALHGLWKMMNLKPIYYMTRYTPAVVLVKIFTWLSDKPFITWLFRKICFDLQKDEEINRVDGLGSMIKAAGTDAAMKNCQMALEIMGQAGIRHDQRAEKILRDSKLLQIYEGTNQVNRINVFKRLIARSCKEADVFSKSII